MDDLGSKTLQKLDKIPVFIGEGHYEVVDFIKRYVDSNHLPRYNNTIVRLDALPDLVIPKDKLVKTALQVPKGQKTLYWDIGMHDWIRNLAREGYVSDVVWVKPPWSKQAEDGSSKNVFGENTEHPNEVNIDIITVAKSMFGTEQDNWDEFSKTVSKHLSTSDPYILDIDLSFFSTINPFLDMYENTNFFPMLEKMFDYESPFSKEPEEIEQYAERRNKKLTELKSYFEHLNEHRTLSAPEHNSELFQQVVSMREELLKEYEDNHIDWKRIFDAGCMCSSYHLPVHRSDRKEVDAMLEQCFERMLDALPSPPTIITIARSCEYDVFVPIKDCNYIEQHLVKCLKKKLDIDQPEMPYLDQ